MHECFVSFSFFQDKRLPNRFSFIANEVHINIMLYQVLEKKAICSNHYIHCNVLVGMANDCQYKINT